MFKIHSDRVLVLFFIFIFCIYLFCIDEQPKYIIYGGKGVEDKNVNNKHVEGQNVSDKNVEGKNDKVSFWSNTDTVKVYIKPSDKIPDFAEDAAEILRNTKFKRRGREDVLNIVISDKNNADVTMEIGDRATMHDYSKLEYDDNNEPIYFSYTYNTQPRRIIFDPVNWSEGVQRSGLSILDYRNYVVRHEMMHALGYEHQPCNDDTARIINGKKVCPVMYQSTRGAPPGYVCGSEITDIDYTKLLPWD